MPMQGTKFVIDSHHAEPFYYNRLYIREENCRDQRCPQRHSEYGLRGSYIFQ